MNCPQNVSGILGAVSKWPLRFFVTELVSCKSKIIADISADGQKAASKQESFIRHCQAKKSLAVPKQETAIRNCPPGL